MSNEALEHPATEKVDEQGRDQQNEMTAAVEVHDWFLTHLVRMANDRGIGVSITLFMGGVLISGVLISGKEYLENFAGEWDVAASRLFGEKPTGQYGRAYAEVAETIYGPKSEEDEDDEPLHYIHLKNATFSLPGMQPLTSKTPLFWRGRLSAVDGYFVGEISPG